MQIIIWSGSLTLAKPDPALFRDIEDTGCQNLIGYHARMDMTDATCRVTLDLKPQHMNRNGVLHGGVVATLLDAVCGNTASGYFDLAEHAPVVTVSLNISFVAAVQGGQLVAMAQAVGGGRSLTYVNGELRDQDGRLLATACGVFKRMR